MVMITRYLEEQVRKDVGKGKVLVIYGPRRVGKTTLAKKLLSETPLDQQLYLNCDELIVQDALRPDSLTRLESTLGKASTIVVDEAQRVKNIGLTLKIIIDAHPELTIIATGSSSFDLANKIKEPLTGRAYEYMLMPLSFNEIQQHSRLNNLQSGQLFEQLMRFGQYPSIVGNSPEESLRELDTIVSNYIYKDTLDLVELRQRQVLPRLLQLLALQVGKEASYNELSNQLDIKVETVERYITLLEESFIVHRLQALKSNDTTMLSNRKRKIYFYDLGVRNMLLSNTNPLHLRSDINELWENFCINERLKSHKTHQKRVEMFYWRGLQGKVDLVEKEAGEWRSYNFAFDTKPSQPPKAFRDMFKDTDTGIITRLSLQLFVK